jgi:hypothetical protein
MKGPAKMVDPAEHPHYNSSPGFSGHRVERCMAGVVMKVKPVGMLLMMLAGRISRYQQDVIVKSKGRAYEQRQ